MCYVPIDLIVFLFVFTVVFTPKEEIDMQSDQKTIRTLLNCNLCERGMNPTINIYNDDTRLCNDCFYQLERAPEMVAKSIEWFLVGNVV